MKILALDTSSEGCSAALLVDDQLTDRFSLAPRGHTRLLMPMVRDLLSEQGLAPAQLDAIAFACGPGSFTGLRIATGVVQGLAYGLGIPVLPVSSLAAVAAQLIPEHAPTGTDTGFAIAFDARMGEVYWGCFLCRDGEPKLIVPERVCRPESLTLPDGPTTWLGAGSGWRLEADMPGALVNSVIDVDPTLVPRAREVALLGRGAWQRGESVAAHEARPVYLRDEVTWNKLPGR
ncbi:tRNA (adenosine(37)-N6)-threonylcarbamoyltransferase complex dimerization subunit type 1 TsaB [Marinobacter salicampi]|uniref:tRNA (adenosine(37)-N6)-threonylcarbamoyltransferase complex dimerization subunit type 1 TsaB n=1 Tax=Marinobacter salicampi TaxID=435907 RepID=UPI00140C60DD|nr:tRNA (adenosine(37)-N6)-threonylcarbamoyltransferase complex dimerization subunit type 1 TsaB [Marinobacter salicampi]